MKFTGFVLALFLVCISSSKQVDRMIDDLITFMWILAGSFVEITGVAIGFALWDRRTMTRPFENRSKKIESELSETKKRRDALVEAPRELSKRI